MEDLGRIIIDVNAAGEGGGGGGGGSLAALRGGAGTVGGIIAGNLSQAGIRGAMGLPAVGGMVAEMLSVVKKTGLVGLAITTVLGGLVIQIQAVVTGFKVLARMADNLADAIADMDPSVLVARAQNEILMFQERLQASARFGGVMGGYETAGGRLDRAMFRLSASLGGIAAAVLTPLLNIAAYLADVIEKKAIPVIVDTAKKILLAIAQVFMDLANMYGESPKMFWGFLAMSTSLSSMANSLGTLANNSNQQTASNQPFIDDLRLMGARI